MSDHDVVVEPSSEFTFRNLNLSEPLVQAVESSGYTVPTPIQARTIPLLLEGRDVLGQAQTGTGKTAAFALPLLERLDISERRTQVLVLTPTRELAIQVSEAFERYGAHLKGLRVAPIYGGQDYQIQFRALDRGVHIVVGTPGRVMDHMRRGSLNLEGLKCLVLDEADEMLRMGFAEDVEWVLTQSPAERQIALFSATVPEPIRRIAQQHLRNPAEVTIEQRTAAADTIRQRFVIAPSHHKEEILGRILEAEPIDGVIVFVKTKAASEPLAEFLNDCGHSAVALNGDIPQKQRERIIDNLRSGRVNIVVATDVAARGLDVQRISHVINYDLPIDSEAYVHRIGRTGRAGRSGEAILFVHPRERRQLGRLEHVTRHRIEPMEVPSNRTINKQRVAKFHERIAEAMAHPEAPTFASLVEQFQREKNVTFEQIAAALAVLANGAQPLLLKDEPPRPSGFSDHGRDRREHSNRSDHRDGRSFDDRRSFGGEEDRRPRSPRRHNSEFETFRIEVGRMHQVQPGQIVGAITNEIGVDRSCIGRINIQEDHSTVDLLEGMPQDVFQTLQRVRVAGRRLDISRLNDARSTATAESSSDAAAAPTAPSEAAPKVKKPKKKKKEAAPA